MAALLVAPTLAFVRLNPFGELIALLVALAVVSAVAFGAHWTDKRRAESDGWRVPENILHVLEFLGGWPGSFIAQQLFRHKTAKLSYQLVFWLIVAAHEYVAVDFLLGWKIAGALKQTIIG